MPNMGMMPTNAMVTTNAAMPTKAELPANAAMPMKVELPPNVAGPMKVGPSMENAMGAAPLAAARGLMEAAK